jgi:hypothetical protein
MHKYTEHIPSWEDDSRLASQKITRLLWNLKVHNRVHKRSPKDYSEPDESSSYPLALFI